MGSKNRVYSQQKLLGQVYTPAHIVDKILAHCQFDGANPIRILDPACGDGRFLVPVVKSILANAPENELKARLEMVQGWDIDKNAIDACRKNLDQVVEKTGIHIDWQLSHRNALEQHQSTQRFDLIIGNPPYIRIQHLPEAQRAYIRTHYKFCQSGSTDAYLAFFELASRLLATAGTCGFITPNSFFTSQTASPLRTYFTKNQNLRHITNYGSVSVFGAASTYAAITIFSTISAETFEYEQCVDNDFSYKKTTIPFSELRNPWHLSVDSVHKEQGRRLGDICKISVGVTTLADRYYLFTILEERGRIVRVKNKSGETLELEKEILKPIVKGSKIKSSQDPVTEYILFPYQKDDSGKQRIIPEEKLKTDFPQSFAYLLKVKPALDRRDNGKPNAVAWYAFGRSQGLDSSFGKKIIFSPMNNKPRFVLYENPDVTVYSGYFIKYDGDYEALLAQLNSDRMAAFIAAAGRDFQGGYKGYNKKAIEHFIITD